MILTPKRILLPTWLLLELYFLQLSLIYNRLLLLLVDWSLYWDSSRYKWVLIISRAVLKSLFLYITFVWLNKIILPGWKRWYSKVNFLLVSLIKVLIVVSILVWMVCIIFGLVYWCFIKHLVLFGLIWRGRVKIVEVLVHPRIFLPRYWLWIVFSRGGLLLNLFAFVIAQQLIHD